MPEVDTHEYPLLLRTTEPALTKNLNRVFPESELQDYVYSTRTWYGTVRSSCYSHLAMSKIRHWAPRSTPSPRKRNGQQERAASTPAFSPHMANHHAGFGRECLAQHLHIELVYKLISTIGAILPQPKRWLS